ncbi:MAG: fibrobacter succinogenes major paralogous domain-containing protein [candidate division Zixibacteria bacterium]|nr:fibrobacter succinogenes major paralogous domain-containing protein [candidate division Zixibacteria bacterium]
MAMQKCSSMVRPGMRLFGWLIPLTIIITLFLVSCGDDKATEPERPITVTDVDGNVYQTITVGSQVWMKENLKVTHYRNGDPIPNVLEQGAWAALSTGAYCNYDNDTAVATIYGRLYNWFAIDDSRNIAPQGWHVATNEDWKKLEISIGISPATADSLGSHGTVEAGKLKEAGTTHWRDPNTGATNESGFTALPAGGRDTTKDFLALYECSFFWASDEYNGGRALFRTMWYDESYISCDAYDKESGFSVRCVRD